MTYIKDKDVVFEEDEVSKYFETKTTDCLLIPGDQLYIRILSSEKVIEDELGNQINSKSSNMAGSEKEDYLNGYLIGETGEVDIPLIGKIKVGGLTVPQALAELQKHVDLFLVNGKVILKLLSFRITFLGEVGEQKIKYFYQDNVNLLEALASVGGLTNAGRNDNILILRKEGNGYRTIRVDLSDRNIIADPNFYLKPNDIVYVQPYKSKAIKSSISDYSTILATITSTITALLLVINVLK
jgi:polysaccharide export outer membrane protein